MAFPYDSLDDDELERANPARISDRVQRKFGGQEATDEELEAANPATMSERVQKRFSGMQNKLGDDPLDSDEDKVRERVMQALIDKLGADDEEDGPGVGLKSMFNQ